MSKRERKCFQRLIDGKSIPDFACLCRMESKGWVTIKGGSDDMNIHPTEAGYQAYRGDAS